MTWKLFMWGLARMKKAAFFLRPCPDNSSSKSTTNRYVCVQTCRTSLLSNPFWLFFLYKSAIIAEPKKLRLFKVWWDLRFSQVGTSTVVCFPGAREDYYFYRAKVLPEKPLSTSIVWWNGRIHFVFFCIAVKSTLKLKDHCYSGWTGREQNRNLENSKGGSSLWNPT